MSVVTVTGIIEKKALGMTLAHEHLLIDLRKLVDRPDPSVNPAFDEPLTIANRYRIFSDPYTISDNALIDDRDIALHELKAFRDVGGKTVVDVTLPEIGRNPTVLKTLSEQSGVNIVMGCGDYVHAAHRARLQEQTVKEIADGLIRELTIGADGTDIRAGVIGEIGTGDPVTDEEWKALCGAGIAAAETGRAMHIHTALWGTHGTAIVERLQSYGVRPERICIDHIDVCLREDYCKRILDAGAYIEFDNFGKEFFMRKRETGLLRGRFACDIERVALVRKLCDAGYERQLLLSNDICLKSMLRAYGGNGYAHVSVNVVPMLLDEGLNERQIHTLLVDNPSEFIDSEDI